MNSAHAMIKALLVINWILAAIAGSAVVIANVFLGYHAIGFGLASMVVIFIYLFAILMISAFIHVALCVARSVLELRDHFIDQSSSVYRLQEAASSSGASRQPVARILQAPNDDIEKENLRKFKGG